MRQDEHDMVKLNQEKNTANQSRRSFLRKSGSIAAATTLAIGGSGVAIAEDEFCEFRQDHSTETILEETKHESPVFITESRIPGPTAVIVGGLQGIEPVGWHTANKIRKWSIDSGKLVLLPEVNPVAIERRTYTNDNGDLNDKFPSGRAPTTKLARAIWEVVENADPDVFFSLHSSHGIYHVNDGPNGVGQAIFPTDDGNARQKAGKTIQAVNNQLDSYRSIYDYTLGNTLNGDRPLLTHKVAGDLDIPGYLIEATRYGTKLKTRTAWSAAIVGHLLQQSGIKVKP